MNEYKNCYRDQFVPFYRHHVCSLAFLSYSNYFYEYFFISLYVSMTKMPSVNHSTFKLYIFLLFLFCIVYDSRNKDENHLIL